MYDVVKLNITPDFDCELILWWSELRDVVNCDGEHSNVIILGKIIYGRLHRLVATLREF